MLRRTEGRNPRRPDQGCDRRRRRQADRERRRKWGSAAPDDPEALVFICNDYVEGGTTLTPDALAAGVAYFLENLDKVAAAEFGKKVRASVTRYLESQAG